MIDNLLQATFSGIVLGCVYALIALSVVIVYKSSEAVNFAGGEIVMIGAYAALLCIVSFDLRYPVIFVVVAGTTFLLGAVFERVVIGQVLRKSGLADGASLVPIVIATLALANMLKGSVRLVRYTDEVRTLPPLIPGPSIFVGPILIERQDIAIVVSTIILVTGFWLFFNYTLVGRALRASSQNGRAALLIGIPVSTMRMIVWGIAGAIAGIAGILLAPKLLITPEMGGVIIMGFAAAVVGGFTNLPGAIVGGIVVGLSQNWMALFLGSRSLTATPFIITMLVLIFRPQGLFGGSVQVKKV